MAKTYGDPKQACPIKDSVLSVNLVDSQKKMVGSIDFQVVDAESKSQAGSTDSDGVAVFNPFKKGKYDVTVKLKDEQKHVYEEPQAKSGTVGDKEEVALL